MERSTVLGCALAELLEAMAERYAIYTELIELEFRPQPLSGILTRPPQPPRGLRVRDDA